MSGYFKSDGSEPIEAHITKNPHTLVEIKRTKNPQQNLISAAVNTNGRGLHNHSLFLFFFFNYHHCIIPGSDFYFFCVLNRKTKNQRKTKWRRKKQRKKKKKEKEKKSQESKDDKESKEESAPPEHRSFSLVYVNSGNLEQWLHGAISQERDT